MIKVSNAMKGYLAGLVDGEGTISISKTRAEEYSHKYRFNCRIYIDSTNKKFLEKVREKVGLGSIYQQKRRSKAHKRLWRWGIYGSDTEKFLEMILPYLQIKKSKLN